MMKKRAKSEPYSWIKHYPNRHALQTMAMDLETLGLYDRLSDSACNNDLEPGTICQQLGIVSAMAQTKVEKVWKLLCEMVPHQSEGRNLMTLSYRDDDEKWKQVCEKNVADAKLMKLRVSMIVKINFAWVSEAEADRAKKNAKNKGYVSKFRANKERNTVRLTESNNSLQDNGKDYKGSCTGHIRGEERREEKSKNKRREEESESATPKAFESWFETVYEKYPKKNKKYQAMEEARKVWAEVDVRRVEEALERSKREDHRFAELRFTPYLVNWLSERPWEQPADAAPDTEREGHATAMNCGMPPELMEEG